MQQACGAGFEWRDGAAYAPLLRADRSLFAWEWLRRDPAYRLQAWRAFAAAGNGRRPNPAAARFGLVGFEAPHLGVPDARPLWRSDASPRVLTVEAAGTGGSVDLFTLDPLAGIATLIAGDEADHLLLSDGFATVRLDSPPGLLSQGRACLRYRIEGLASAEPLALTLRQFLALSRSGGFARSLHPPETRARRWILLLRAWDALQLGAGQRAIAEVLLARSAADPRWRTREPSLRSRAQRLVRGARTTAAGGYRMLLG